MKAIGPWLAAALALLCICAPARAAPSITVLHTQPYVFTVNPSQQIAITYRFKSTAPTAASRRVFVHFINAAGKIVFQDDHQPPAATSQWYGEISYQRFVTLPSAATSGRYQIAVGLFDPPTRVRTPLGTVADPASTEPSYTFEDRPGSSRYVVGELYVTTKPIVEAPFACNGNDVTAALSRALRNLASGQVLKLPFGSCQYSGALGINAMRLDRKTDVEVVGHGAPSTRLIATDKLRSGFIVYGSSGILLRDFRIEVARPPGYAERTGNADAIGVYVENSSKVELRQLAILNPLGPGIQFYRATDSRAMRNFVQRPAADGIHIAGPSSNIALEDNTVFDSGDDGLSSIGYVGGAQAGPNHDITIRNNRVRFRDVKWGSGVAVEGTAVAQVLNNYIERSGAAGIRIASIEGYAEMDGVRYTFVTGGVSNVEVAGNELVDTKTRAELGHGAMHIAAMSADLRDLQVHSNTISSASLMGTATDAVRVVGRVTPAGIYYVRNTRIWNNTVRNLSPGVLAPWCIVQAPDTTTGLVLNTGLQGQVQPNVYVQSPDGARTFSQNCAPQTN
ncbi:right-handed parallel beta-helix repeat-containing protein [Pseudorhodoferax sp. Leaf267]|uniref:right-handed parallel beta-helix repeat-containing protein n=1 Tax=Pseudorhodoferax sp. Leaf267 TaxID=1736316 RepID=UPI0006F487AD|nr:right-handed parallel beta-helix repeat-containing protein [Pseudorhodoferax sp. Leaf267]KQP15124.1 hypothetical protein ASF43_13920 [Pseudorhodoferax sp. Leaf267]